MDAQRHTYVFALRSQLPVPEEGWGVVIHRDGCHEDETDPIACRGAIECRLFAADAESHDLSEAVSLMAATASSLTHSDRPDAAEPPSIGFPHLMTIATVSINSTTPDGSTFEVAMGTLTDASRALLQATQALSAPVTRQQLWPFYAIVSPQDNRSLGVSMVVMDDAYFGPPRATRDQAHRADLQFFAKLGADPVEIYHDLELSARREAVVDGDYSGAILKAAAACEVLIKHTAWYLTWEAQERLERDPTPMASTAPGIFASKPAQLIGGVLTSRLAGSWSSRGEGPVAQWRQYIARQRNAVIHLGHRPIEDDAAAALHAMDALEALVMDRLAACAERYPRTALKLVGRAGLERRSCFGTSVAQVWDTESIGEHLIQYVRWLTITAPEGPDD